MADLRAHVEALPRFVLVTQDREGWTKAKGRASDPVMNEVVLLADVLARGPERLMAERQHLGRVAAAAMRAGIVG